MLLFGTKRVSLAFRLILILVVFDFLELHAQTNSPNTNTNDATDVNKKGGAAAAGGRGGGARGGSRGGGSRGGSRGGGSRGIPKEAALLLVGVAALTLINNNNAELARQYDEAAKAYLDGVPRPYIQPDDPPDDVINMPLDYQGAFIYEHNPCQWYQERLTSFKNKRRKHGCRKSARRFRRKAKNVPSARCPNPGGGRCFQIANHTGRCYLIVNQDDTSKIHYELINRC